MSKGSGVIVIWHDITDEGREDFYEWHNREHIPERVGIEGFLRGRRYIGVQGEPKFFTLYNVRSPAVLGSKAYHDRLNSPSPWTLRAVEYFSNESRSLCEVKFSDGVGSGGFIGTVRFDCDTANDARINREFSESVLPKALQRPGIVAVHLCCADVEVSKRRSAEQEGKEDNMVPRWVVMVEATAPETIEKLFAEAINAKTLAALEVPQSASSIYALQHDLGRLAK